MPALGRTRILSLIVGLIVCLLAFGQAHAAPFERSQAIVIGIDDYRANSWKDLSYAAADARRVAGLLERQGYKVTLLVNADATRSRIIDALYAAARELKGTDRLLFYFGGHGHTETISGSERGYLVPQDADGVAGMISMEEIRQLSGLMGSLRHQLFVLNACYGGSIGILRSAVALDPKRPDYIDQITSRAARQFVAAGGPDQEVQDDGPGGLSWFTHFFLEAVETNAADLDGDKTITFSELTAYLLPRASNSQQTPSFGALPGHALGEYVFATAEKPAPRQEAVIAAAAKPTTDVRSITDAGENFTPMQQPIHDLFAAWEKLDVDGYLNQWSRNARQFVGGKPRAFAEIASTRKGLFPRLGSVNVERYQLWFRDYKDGVASFDASYSMVFNFKNGRVVREQQRETYRVARERGRWVIVENRDYLR